MLLHEILQTSFSNHNDNSFFFWKIKTYRPSARQKYTHVTRTGSSRIFKRMVPVHYSYQWGKKVSRTFAFACLASNGFAHFPSLTSRLVHISLHLSTWSPRFTNHDLYLRCRSLVGPCSSVHCSSWQFQTISIHFHVFYAVSHEKVRKMKLFQTHCPR